MARLWKWRYQESDTYWRRENIFTFSCLDIFGQIKFGENASILNTKLIKFSAITPKPFSKKYREERHKRIKKHSVPESVKWNKYHTIHYIKSFVLHFATIELKTDKPLSFFNLQAFFFFFKVQCNLKDTGRNRKKYKTRKTRKEFCLPKILQLSICRNDIELYFRHHQQSAFLEKYTNSYCPQFPSRTAWTEKWELGN